MSDYPILVLALYSAFVVFAVFFAVCVIALRNPVYSAFSLVMVLFNVAAVFAMLEAHFIAAIQIMVYAGAIMVLFVFVIMLLNLDELSLDFPMLKHRYGSAFLLSVSSFVLIVLALTMGGSAPNTGDYTPEAIQHAGGNILTISRVMFSDWIYAFELVGLLLTMAVVGAVILAKRKVD